MAKWGEGDPRWIVEERPDATNVNNWHWTEKNASLWSKEKLKELLNGLKIDESGLGVCEITEVKSIEGEAIANNRKGKLIFFFEWVIKTTWKGRLNGVDEDVEGEIEIPNLSEENTADEIDVNVSVKNDNVQSEVLKEVMRNKGANLIREQIKLYLKLLRDEYAKDLIKPTKVDESGSINSFSTAKQDATRQQPTSVQNAKIQATKSVNGTIPNKAVGKLETSSISLTESMKCTADEFYRAFTIPEMVAAFSQSKPVLNVVAGGKFELFNGNVTGVFTQLDENRCIKQRWRFKGWPVEHYSEVTITLDQKEDCTEVNVLQTGVPRSDIERTEVNWKRYYFEAMKRTFGFGAMLH